MKTLNRMSLFILIVVSLISMNWLYAAGVGNNISVRMVGTGTAFPDKVLFEAFGLTPLGGSCFDADLIDVKTGNVIGTATDCLSSIEGSETDNGLMLTGTTFFFFPGGTLVSQGLTTVQPVLHGSVNFTHITGAVPSYGENSVVYGDGKFKNAAGPVRLSGAVNLSALLSNGRITFDCVFIIDI
ncbi:MAG: hypothetical protein ABFS32_19975 [Bacteroidota bacterium]